MTQHDEFRLTDEYQEIRYAEYISWTEAEEKLGRKLTEAESLAIYDNLQDQVLIDMGR